MKQIAVIVVTYNRKEFLKRCLNALFQQEYLPAAIYIIDNNSSDGTNLMLQEENYLSHNKIKIFYINTGKNLGGAGGFYTGLKVAHESGLYDAYLLMDDDGCPDKDEIKELVPYLSKYHYLNALVVDIEDEAKLSFPWTKEIGQDRKKASAMQNEEGIVLNYASPFNGTMVSKQLVNKVGYPKAEMFIYGDEIEYRNRSKRKGFIPITVVKSIHRHPHSKGPILYCNILGRKIPYVLKDNPLMIYCLHRNQLYNASTLKDYLKVLFIDVISLYYYNKKSKHLRNVALSAIRAGFKHDFSGHIKYIKE